MRNPAAILQVLAIIGLLASVVALRVVERNAHRRARAWCDFSAHSSCTKAFSSPHGRLLRIHNAWIGAGFYVLVFLLAARQQYAFILVLSTIAVVASLYLAYVAYVEMRNFCVVCTAVYLTNALLLLLSYRAVFG